MTLAAVREQPRAVDALKGALRTGSIHHAYLFGGPEGVGKELTALGFAQALLCQEAPLEGCGVCSTCTRIERRNHPDVMLLMPEEELVARGMAGRADFTHVPSREIRVEQIRQLQERLTYRALEGKRKVALVASAHLMNTQAQNAFLKTLEEPPSDTLLVLLASSPDKLLPTIRSRCSKVHFGPLPEAFIAARLCAERKLDEATAGLVAVMSGGSLSRALAMDVERLSVRRELIEKFEAVRGDDARTVLRFAEAFGGSREDALDALELLAVWLRDLAVLRSGGSSLANRDLTELAQKAAAHHPEGELFRRHRLLDSASTAISSRNGSPRLQLERMLIEMTQAVRA